VCESFHSKINAYFYHHPSLYKFINALQDVQVDTYIKIRSVEAGEEQQQMKEDGRISRYEFLKKVGFKNKRKNVKLIY
jgi:hypothetical protein